MNCKQLNKIRKKANKDANRLHEFSNILVKSCIFLNKKITYDEILNSFGCMKFRYQMVLNEYPELASAINGIYCNAIYKLYTIVDTEYRQTNGKTEIEKVEYLASLLLHEWCNITYKCYDSN